jgi:hypothetical protein
MALELSSARALLGSAAGDERNSSITYGQPSYCRRMALENVPIRKIIERVLAGEIRIPAFQREYVWSPENVAFLMDSIYRGYPIGALLLWQTREALTNEKQLGPFELPKPRENWPIEYVLDGQQRITSLFGVFQTELRPNEPGDWFDIYFDLRAPEGALEEQFVPVPPDQVQVDRHFPLRSLFDPIEYRKATDGLSAEDIKRVDVLQARFKEAFVPVETITTPEREQVAIIFERVNRAGVPLDTFQLLSAWTWSPEFDLTESFRELAAEVEPFGFEKIENESNLLIRCCAAVISNDASPATIVNLHGPTVRERFQEVRTGVLGAIDFLRQALNVFSLDVMPFPAMVVPLAKFFATTSTDGYHPTSAQRVELVRWLWRSFFSRRYSSGVGRALATDIAALAKLRADEVTKISNFSCSVDSRFFLENTFGLGSVNTRTFLLLLASLSPKSLMSGVPVNLQEVLKQCNATEFHHVFPKKYLTASSVESKRQNLLANICFLSRSDNQRISGRAPSEYKGMLAADSLPDTLLSNGLPTNALDITYDQFLHDRSELLVARAQALIA